MKQKSTLNITPTQNRTTATQTKPSKKTTIAIVQTTSALAKDLKHHGK